MLYPFAKTRIGKVGEALSLLSDELAPMVESQLFESGGEYEYLVLVKRLLIAALGVTDEALKELEAEHGSNCESGEG